MGKINYVGAGGETTTVDVADGTSLMQAAMVHGIIGIVGECGGSMMCATCHVYVREPWLGRLLPMVETEHEMLTMTTSERRPSSRLSCQIVMTPELDGITVELPETQL